MALTPGFEPRPTGGRQSLLAEIDHYLTAACFQNFYVVKELENDRPEKTITMFSVPDWGRVQLATEEVQNAKRHGNKRSSNERQHSADMGHVCTNKG